MLFPEAAKRGIALVAVAVAAPLQAGMWAGQVTDGDAQQLSSLESYGVRLLDTELAAPVLPAPTTATEQRPLVAEPSTGSATVFYAERVLHARLERAAPIAEDAVASRRTLIRGGEARSVPTLVSDVAGFGWQAF